MREESATTHGNGGRARRRGRATRGVRLVATLLIVVTGAGVALAQGAAPAAPDGVPRFRYDETSGRCLDAEGREGYNPGSVEALRRGGPAECADFRGRAHNLTYLRLSGANLRGANFEGALFYLGTIADSDLTGADLAGSSGQMEYTGSRLRRARLSHADLSWSDLRGADLAGADLRGARFSSHSQLPFDGDEARRRGMVFVPSP